MVNKLILYFLNNKFVTVILLLTLILWGIITSPFGWNIGRIPSDPVRVDAIPDIGENQQIVFTRWPGRSPQDVEDQVTYPMTSALLGVPGVKSIRSSSSFGISSIYIIFKEDIDFYWSRSRILEKLNSLPSKLLPEGVTPLLGPDATALGQVYWYTLEGRDKNGNETGGWSPQELRSIQDFYVKYGLSATSGVSEVASIGGYVKEYQIDVHPDALKTYNISLEKVIKAIKKSNQDVGAQTLEINKVEYLIRGIGYIKSISDINRTVVSVYDNTPITIKDIAKVSIGPATRRGALDKDGIEAVGGVVVARYGSNPMKVINNIKDKIKEISTGLPKKTLDNGTESQLTIVPFYDRSKLINETLETLEEALSLEVLISILVVIVMLLNLRASIVICTILPIAILMVFIAMRYLHIDANIVALSGIAIAIGTMVDLGIILCENVDKHIKIAPPSQKLSETIYKASCEVSSAIITGVMTTIIGFIPVFTLEGAEGKLFRPLAFTKTFALISALIVALFILPTIIYWTFGFKIRKKSFQKTLNIILILFGLFSLLFISTWAGLSLIGFGMAWLIREYYPQSWISRHGVLIIALLVVTWLLCSYWSPLGLEKSVLQNFIFVAFLLFLILGFFKLLEKLYPKILGWCLAHKKTFLAIPIFIIFIGINVWFGFNHFFGFIADGADTLGLDLRNSSAWTNASKKFPGVKKEFMPPLEEGSFLLMPTSMSHAGIEQNKKTLQKLNLLIADIPEIDISVGKLGRVASALDPAPISMYENIINYKPEYRVDENNKRIRYSVNKKGLFILSSKDTLDYEDVINRHLERKLIKDKSGHFFRNWRREIKSSNDIWKEIAKVSKIPGLTSAPKLQPIQTRLIMLQTGMRSPMGIKVFGPDLETIQAFGLELEKLLKEVPSIKKQAVFADRIVGKPYIYLNINRNKISQYGLHINDVQKIIETAVGGIQITSTVEGRERFPVRVRYPREFRDNPNALGRIYISTYNGSQIPLSDILDIQYVRGPQLIKSENTFLVGYVLFDKKENFSEVEVVNQAMKYIQEHIDSSDIIVPKGVNYKFAGNYENVIHAEKRLSIIIPAVLVLIFIILYFQFKSVPISLMVFSSVFMAFSGAFMMIWLYGQSWFLDFSFLGTNMRSLFQIHPINLSVAVWVGFIALFGIATDDSVLIATYMNQNLSRKKPKTPSEVRKTVIESGVQRIKPAIMTAATTIIALLPILTSKGKGSDIMIPMAIPILGGMIVCCITFFITPVLYSIREERKLNKTQS